MRPISIELSPSMSATIKRFTTYGRRIQAIAAEFGWQPGARYTNLRDVRDVTFKHRGFLDICWKNYDFQRHITATQQARPLITVARDIENIENLNSILKEAEALKKFSKHVVLVPKDLRLSRHLDELPSGYLLGYSCPTLYGATPISPKQFRRPVHLLGGRPDVQRRLADHMPVYSFDCNRFTLDAGFGDFFDGQKFRPLGEHNFFKCIRLSLENINAIWADYPSITL